MATLLRIVTADGMEFFLTLLAVCCGFFAPRIGGGLFGALEGWLVRASRHRKACIVAAGIAPLAIRLLLLPVLARPEPGVHDEFSHLLAADTLAHGRLTNPAHPMWRHFESFHILQQPSYASMEPPGFGLAMALGQVVFGHPWAGVLIAVGLMCSAVAWMLFEWFAAPWALVGSIIFILRFAIVSYWVDGYWGGAVAAMAGALLYGAVPGLLQRPSAGRAVTLGAALVILMNTRPLEGMMAAVPVAVWLGFALLRKRVKPWDFGLRVAAPVALLLLLGFGFIGMYNRAVTGDALRMPHTVNREQYALTPYFRWQPLHAAPVYRHAVMADFYQNFEAEYFRQEAGGVLPLRIVQKYLDAYFFLFGAVFGLALAAGGWWKDPRLWAPLSGLALFLLGLFATSAGFLGHYAAPLIGGLMIVVVNGLQRLREFRWRGVRAGLLWSRAVPAICLAMVCWSVACQASGRSKLNNPLYFPWQQNRMRANMIAKMAVSGERHLVLVRYNESHIVHEEWVYNDADIDGSPVVWARDMGDAQNGDLLRYFAGRRIWLFEPDRADRRLQPYPATQISSVQR